MSRRTAFVAALAILSITLLAAGAGAVVSVGPNKNISKKAGNQMEEAIAIDRSNTMRVFAFTNDETLNLAGLATARSTDGGTNWTTGVIGTGADGFPAACCDPTLAADGLGNIFLSYLNLGTPDTIPLLVSTNGGSSWTNLGTVESNTSLDQPTVAVGANTVWLTWRDSTSGAVQARGAPITGLGTIGAFNTTQSIPGSASGNFGDIAIGPTGQVLVTYETPSGGQGPASLNVSLDADGLGAGVFAAATLATTTNVGGFDFIPPQPDRSVDAEVGLAYDRSGGTHNGRVYLMYTEEPTNENNDTDILVRFSDTNGAAWSAPVQINDDATTNSQFNPKMAVDQTNGQVAVTWHDARSDTGGDPDGANNDVEYWGSRSLDGGVNWETNFKVSAGISDEDGAEPPAACCADLDYGDYSGIDFHAGVIRPVWGDNSNSTGDNPDGTLDNFDTYTAAVSAPTGVFLSRFAAGATRGGIALTWRTAAESELLGFNIYRSSAGVERKVNFALIGARASGKAAGASYRFVDRNVRRGVAYTYRLELVQTNGTTRGYGSVHATVR